jgi:hypothetical protein
MTHGPKMRRHPEWFKKFAIGALLLVVLAACSGQREPAQKMIGDIEATVAAASADAAQYVPDQLVQVQNKLGDLKASYDKEDYKTVVSGAPAVMSAAQSLESAAAAKKDLVTKGLNGEWTGLAAALPGEASAVRSRIEFLSKPVNRKLAGGVDLDEAKSSLSDAIALWAKAQASFGGGDLNDAVTIAKTVKTKLDALAASFKLDLSRPAAVQDTTSDS